MINRRSMLLGLGAALAAPAVVKAESIMKVASLRRWQMILVDDPVVHAGLLYEGTRQVGWWNQLDTGALNFKLDVGWSKLQAWNASFETARQVMEVHNVKPYAPVDA